MLETKHVPILHLRYPARILIQGARDRDNWIGPRKRPSQLRSAVMTGPPRFQPRYRLEDLFSFGIDVSVTAEMSVQKAEGTRFACERKTFPHQSTRKAASLASLELVS
jgi:hypothetical protein